MPLDQFLTGQSPQNVADAAATWGDKPGALAQLQQQNPNVGFGRARKPGQRMQLLQMLVQTGRARDMQEADAIARSQGQ